MIGSIRPSSDEVAILGRHIDERIETLRSKLEGDLTQEQTMKTRGHIAGLRTLVNELREVPQDTP